MGSRGEDPIKGLVDKASKLILTLEIDVKLIFYEGKIENAYMSRCFLKKTHAAVLSAVQLTILIWVDGNIAIGGCIPTPS